MRFSLAVAASVAAALVAGLGQGEALAAAPPISPGDEVLVYVPADDPPERRVTVDADGHVDLGLYGRVKVAGRSERNARRAVVRRLSRFIADPAGVRVVLTQQRRLVLVSGLVPAPGPIPLEEGAGLWTAVTRAGGPAPGADLGAVRVLRGSSLHATVDLRAWLSGVRDPALPELETGDTVFVPADPSRGRIADHPAAFLDQAALDRKVVVLGAVRNPGVFERSPGVGPLMALALAGGALSKADLSRVRVVTSRGSRTLDLAARVAGAGVRVEGGLPDSGALVLFVPHLESGPTDPLGSYVNVVGEVREPGRLRVPGVMRLTDVVAATGGVTVDGDEADVSVLHVADGLTIASHFDLERVHTEGGLAAHAVVHPGDTVRVGEADPDFWEVVLSALGDVAIVAAAFSLFLSL